MSAAFLALAGPAGSGVVFGVGILWDRWRAPRRDIRRPIAVVDMRTYRDATVPAP
jgi:hypothetical protein